MTEDLGVWEGLVLSETEKLGVVALLVSCIASGHERIILHADVLKPPVSSRLSHRRVAGLH